MHRKTWLNLYFSYVLMMFSTRIFKLTWNHFEANTWNLDRSFVPCHLSCNLRVVEDLGSIVPLVSGDWHTLWCVAVAHNLQAVLNRKITKPLCLAEGCVPFKHYLFVSQTVDLLYLKKASGLFKVTLISKQVEFFWGASYEPSTSRSTYEISWENSDFSLRKKVST